MLPVLERPPPQQSTLARPCGAELRLLRRLGGGRERRTTRLGQRQPGKVSGHGEQLWRNAAAWATERNELWPAHPRPALRHKQKEEHRADAGGPRSNNHPKFELLRLLGPLTVQVGRQGTQIQTECSRLDRTPWRFATNHRRRTASHRGQRGGPRRQRLQNANPPPRTQQHAHLGPHDRFLLKQR